MGGILGIDVGATYTRAVLVDGEPVALGRWETGDDAERIADILDEIRRACRTRDFCVVALALAAALDDAGVICRWPNRPNTVGLPLQSLATRHLGRPVIWIDDGAAAAMAEHRHATCANGSSETTTLYVGVGTGIASGAVISGRLHRGATGAAFSLGHKASELARGVTCSCGRTGCLQAVASGRALAPAVAAAGLPRHQLAVCADAGIESARAILRTIVAPLGEALKSAACMLDPDRLVIGGGMSTLFLVDELRDVLRRAGIDTPIERSRLGGSAAAIGAAMFASTLAHQAAPEHG